MSKYRAICTKSMTLKVPKRSSVVVFDFVTVVLLSTTVVVALLLVVLTRVQFSEFQELQSRISPPGQCSQHQDVPPLMTPADRVEPTYTQMEWFV